MGTSIAISLLGNLVSDCHNVSWNQNKVITTLEFYCLPLTVGVVHCLLVPIYLCLCLRWSYISCYNCYFSVTFASLYQLYNLFFSKFIHYELL